MWNIDAQTPFLLSVATSTAAADQWYDLSGNPLGTSADLSVTADSSLPGQWLAAQLTLWFTSAGTLAQSDIQLVLTPSGAAAMQGTPLCNWAGGPVPPPSFKNAAPASAANALRQYSVPPAVLRRALHRSKLLVGGGIFER